MRFNEQLSKYMARDPQTRGAQCNRIGCIGLRPALPPPMLTTTGQCLYTLIPQALCSIEFLAHVHRRSQGGLRGHGHPKF